MPVPMLCPATRSLITGAAGYIGSHVLLQLQARGEQAVAIDNFSTGYYGNNTGATRNLLDSCMHAGVRQLLFSSTAAVYGNPAGGICGEQLALAPVNPYGTSKLMSEWMLRDQAASSDFRYVSLRYFNGAGSDLQGRLG